MLSYVWSRVIWKRIDIFTVTVTLLLIFIIIIGQAVKVAR